MTTDGHNAVGRTPDGERPTESARSTAFERPLASKRPAVPARRSTRHPLLGAFPLAVMTLATFLVVFAIMMARLQGGLDPALRATAGSTTVVRGSGGAVVTRASGGAAPALSPSGAPARSGGPVLTRTSGSSGGGESDDA